ncbi:MAG TPA: hypothetical protein VMZ53_02695 [Kofleriaceae bacterium]|nr:hypothetical protein [Kofleriaceae bacterium]
MKKLAVNALLQSVSATAEQLGVRALLRMWQRATTRQLAGKSL